MRTGGVFVWAALLEVAEPAHRLGGVGAQRAVGGRAAVGGVDHPVAADHRRHLEAGRLGPGLPRGIDRSQVRRPRPDDTDTLAREFLRPAPTPGAGLWG